MDFLIQELFDKLSSAQMSEDILEQNKTLMEEILLDTPDDEEKNCYRGVDLRRFIYTFSLSEISQNLDL